MATMTRETKELVLRGLSYLRSDDFERAKAAFRGMSDAQMDEYHGHSGKTRREILQEYSAHAESVERAITEVTNLSLQA